VGVPVPSRELLLVAVAGKAKGRRREQG